MKITADFETTTDENDCRVWAWAVNGVEDLNYFKYGNSLDEFFKYIQTIKNSTIYFHNLKFDGEFIFNWLFRNGFKHVENKKDETDKSFSTLITHTGVFYSIRICFKVGNKRKHYIEILDSLKILPFPVEDIAKAFNLPISKLKIDYEAYREINHILTNDEIDYIKNDVKIVASALKVLFEQNLTKMTQASNALFDYKNTVGMKNFERWFPTPDYDSDVRQSYKGGFTYLHHEYKNRDVKSGLVLDVNSLYPSVMRNCKLPYGEPIYFEGKYKEDKLYNVYVQMFSCQFELKENHIPTVQLKNNLSFIPTQYLHSSKDSLGNDQIITMCMTSVDLKLFLDHYNVYNLTYHSGWKFKSTTGLFTDYIDKWTKIKNESTLNGNKAMRTLAKLMLNALYGKFALNPIVQSKYPYYDNGVVKYRTGEKDKRTPLYIPVGTFITAYAREKTIRSAQKVYDKFIYADTDSLHLNINLPDELSKLSNEETEMLTTADLQKYGVDLPNDFIIDPVELGAWKVESRFYRGRYIRQKCYIEDWNKPQTWNTEEYNKDLLNITCAGMPKQCYQYVTWDNFKVGASFEGKLIPKHVKGGIVLDPIEYTIKPA